MQTTPTRHEIAAWIIMACLMLLIIKVHLLPALLAGLLVFELTHIITPYIARKFPRKRAQMMAVGLLAAAVVGLISLVVVGLTAFLRSDAGSVHAVMAQLAGFVEDSRKILPQWLDARLPSDAIALQQAVIEWLREHADTLQFAGKEFGRHLAHILVAMIIGGMLALREVTLSAQLKPFAQAMQTRAALFGEAFKNIVFAQVRISAINACVTGVYLAIILPMLGIHLPLTKTLIAVTFIVGLLPVVGNLISNTMIVVVSMSQSLTVAIASLIFLVVIHKLEYFLNARIVGGQIKAKAWELLIAMLLMEATFGLVGILAAPIYYAYVKSELRERGLV